MYGELLLILGVVLDFEEEPALVSVGVGVVPQVALILIVPHLGHQLQVGVLVFSLKLDIFGWAPSVYSFRHDKGIPQFVPQQLIGLTFQKSRAELVHVPDEAVGVDLFGLFVDEGRACVQDPGFQVFGVVEGKSRDGNVVSDHSPI